MEDLGARDRKKKAESVGAQIEALARASPLLLWPDPG
jgi:hypothetical protein